MLAIGVPSYMPSSKKSGRGLYFVSMREAAAITSINSTRSSLGECNLRDPPFADLELGTLLGKGGYGSVYRGSYKEQRCAVKVPPCTLLPCVWGMYMVSGAVIGASLVPAAPFAM